MTQARRQASHNRGGLTPRPQNRSSPRAKGQMPAATSAALPLLLPPVWCPVLCGLRAVPVTGLSPVVPRPEGQGDSGMAAAPSSAGMMGGAG